MMAIAPVILVAPALSAHNNYELEALLKGEKFNPSKHEIGTEVKAITYSFMELKESEEQVEIKIVFDI